MTRRAADSAEEAGDWIEAWHKDGEEERTAQWAVVDADADCLLGRVALRETRFDDGTAEVVEGVAAMPALLAVLERAGVGVATVTLALIRTFRSYQRSV
ncbi:hypothetical protein [Streptomyces sp. NPDC056479]|uniref:hypothetical protein n=1 Tax=unclassified Streptomyces TaxID=2593676 RepID=UPI00368F7462